MDQAFAEGGFAYDEAAVVVLDCTGNDLGGGGCAAVYQDYQRVIFAAVAVGGVVALLRGGPAVVAYDDLALL